MTAADSTAQPQPADDIVPDALEISFGITNAVHRMFEELGEAFPRIMLFHRADTSKKLPWFGKYAGRAFLPVSGIVELQRRRKIARGVTPEEIRRSDGHAPEAMTRYAVAGWMVEKICASFSLSVYRAVLGGGAGWRDLTCDWLLERCRAMALFLKFPEEDPDGDYAGAEGVMHGCIAGFTVREDGLALFLQGVETDGDTPPEKYIEVPLHPGRTLGEAVRRLRYDHVAFDELARRFDSAEDGSDFRRRMTRAMREVAEIALPLLAAALGDDFERRCCRWHPSHEVRLCLGSEIPCHRPDDDQDALEKALYDEFLTIVEITMPAAEAPADRAPAA